MLQVTADGPLLDTVARLARRALLELVPVTRWERLARRVAALLSGMEAKYQFAGLSVSLPAVDADERVAGTASGDPSRDLTDLLVALGEVAKELGRGVVMLFDELQYAPIPPLAALVAALHKVAQRALPVTLVAAGLPQTRGVLAEAATYSERMFETRTVGALGAPDAFEALAEPAQEIGVRITDAALRRAFEFTEGYPFFLQVFGDHLWRLAAGTTIRLADAEAAVPLARDWLDRGFFTFRTDRLSVAQRRYLRAMAELGPAEQSSGEVAAVLGLASSAPVGTVRDALIKRGLIYSPRLGYAAFTVPQFDDYLRRHFELEAHSPRRRPG